MPMRFDIISIFPEMFGSVFATSILKRAVTNKKISVRFFNPREQARDKHKTIDDAPYGGGVGMVMKTEPLARTIKSIRATKHTRRILLSARGRRLTQQHLQRLAKNYRHLVLVCGHYEGVDERIKHFVDEEISIGDYVLTGGELGAMVIVDGVSRLVPGVLGKSESARDESHSQPGYIEYPQYTRPRIYKNLAVPKILLSGDHARISQWRMQHAHLSRTKKKR